MNDSMTKCTHNTFSRFIACTLLSQEGQQNSQIPLKTPKNSHRNIKKPHNSKIKIGLVSQKNWTRLSFQWKLIIELVDLLFVWMMLPLQSYIVYILIYIKITSIILSCLSSFLWSVTLVTVALYSNIGIPRI